MDKSFELAKENVGRLMLKYFIPAFIGVFVNALYNIVDRIFIGQGVGSVALSGVSVIFPVMLVMIAFGMLIGIGAGVLVSINMGRKNKERAELVLGNSFVLMIVASIAITAIGFMIKGPMLKAFGATPETLGYANEYLNVILIGVIFQVVGFSLNNVIRSEGNAKVAMYSMILSAGTNLVLDPIFIFWLDLGVKGAAYATLISMIVLAVWVLLHFRSKNSVVKIKAHNMKIDPEVIREILVIGMAPFFMQIANSVVQAVVNTKLIQFGGDIAVGAMGIVNSVATMIIMCIVAINMASQPIIGFNYGAKENSRVKEALKLALISSTLISLLAFALVQFAPDVIIRLFNGDDEQLMAIGTQGLRIGLLALPIVGFQVVAGNFFQSIGNSRIATMLTLVRQVFALIPLLFILPSFFELNGIWMSMPISDCFAAVIVIYFLRRQWGKLS